MTNLSPWCMGQKCKSFYSGFKRLHAAAQWNWALWKKGGSYSKWGFWRDVAADPGSAKCVKMNAAASQRTRADRRRRYEGDDTWAQPGERLPSAGHRICPECTARPPPRRQEVRYGCAISNVAKPRITAWEFVLFHGELRSVASRPSHVHAGETLMGFL